MLLEALRNFEWFNEAADVAFDERGVRVTASPQTDFWQDAVRGYHRDNGHFFFARRCGSFVLTVCWRFGIPAEFAQCGLMGRIDKNHWFKISVMSKNGSSLNIGSVVTAGGCSDMALTPLSAGSATIWFRLKKNDDGSCELSYSVNGKVFIPVRLFRLPVAADSLSAGVFACSPSEKPYTALLTSIDFS